ncbi:MAG: hypothetical protein JWM37_591 [Candidatus Saccharibacteria bacterium]|nr:hypothetical protein [Candidatus Saccharibacteria bacterium]
MSQPRSPQPTEQIFTSIEALSLRHEPEIVAFQASAEAPIHCESDSEMQRAFAAQMLRRVREELPDDPAAEQIAPLMPMAIGSFALFSITYDHSMTVVSQTTFITPGGDWLRRTAHILTEDPQVTHSLGIDRIEPQGTDDGYVDAEFRMDINDRALIEAASDLFLDGYGDEAAYFRVVNMIDNFEGERIEVSDLLDAFPDYFEVGEGSAVAALLPGMNRQLAEIRRQNELRDDVPGLFHPTPEELGDVSTMLRRLASA